MTHIQIQIASNGIQRVRILKDLENLMKVRHDVTFFTKIIESSLID